MLDHREWPPEPGAFRIILQGGPDPEGAEPHLVVWRDLDGAKHGASFVDLVDHTRRRMAAEGLREWKAAA